MGSIVNMTLCGRFLKAFADHDLKGLKGEVPEFCKPSLFVCERTETVRVGVYMSVPGGASRLFEVYEAGVVYNPDADLQADNIKDIASLLGVSTGEVLNEMANAEVIEDREVDELCGGGVFRVDVFVPLAVDEPTSMREVLSLLSKARTVREMAGWSFREVEGD